MKNNRQVKSGRLIGAGFGLMILAVGLTWLGKSAGIVPADFEPLKFACPACVALFGAWIVYGQFVRKGARNGDEKEERDVQV